MPRGRLTRRWRTIALLALFLGVVATLGFGIFRGRAPGEGLVVHVEVVGARGKPVPRTRVQRRYGTDGMPLGSQGTARVTNVVLRHGEAPTPRSVGSALVVSAPGHATRPGDPPAVEPLDGGAWRAKYVVWPCGRLRLFVRSTTLEGVRAQVETDRDLKEVEAEEGVEFARLGAPAGWRVFGKVEHLVVRVEGAAGVALERFEVEAPGRGFTRELEIVAQPAAPIHGRVVVPGDEKLPSLAGQVHVAELAPRGRIWDLPSVWIDEDGRFEVPYAAATSHYRLTVETAFLDIPPVAVRGGEEVEITEGQVRPWVEWDASSEDTGIEGAYVWAEDVTRNAPVDTDGRILSRDGRAFVALPGPGTYRVGIRRPGGQEALPQRGFQDVEVAERRGHPVRMLAGKMPAGDVKVRIDAPPGRGAATVELLVPRTERRTSFASGDEILFQSVEQGAVRIDVMWTDTAFAPLRLAGELDSGDVLQLTARAVVGGGFVARGHGADLVADFRPRWLNVEEGPGVLPDEVPSWPLFRAVGTRDWKASYPLLPGVYRATLGHALDEEERGRSLQFEIRAGQTTTVEFDVPAEERPPR